MKTPTTPLLEAPAPARSVAIPAVDETESARDRVATTGENGGTSLARTDDMPQMFERLASDPNVSVEKLERLLAMHERLQEAQSRAAFNAAFSDMAAEIPTIIERGKTDKAKYALLEDIVETVRPILQRHGFSLSFRTEWPDKKTVKVVGILMHRDGHSRESEFLSEADTSGSKNAIQALGSAVSYGHRYTAKDLLNITSRGEDDDGARTTKIAAPAEPSGYADWLDTMNAVADEGLGKLQVTFQQSKREFREYVTKHDAATWANLKAKAAKVVVAK